MLLSNIKFGGFLFSNNSEVVCSGGDSCDAMIGVGMGGVVDMVKFGAVVGGTIVVFACTED